MYIYKFSPELQEGEWGSEIVTSQLGIKLTNVLFAYKFHCMASYFGETLHVSPAIPIDKMSFDLKFVCSTSCELLDQSDH